MTTGIPVGTPEAIRALAEYKIKFDGREFPVFFRPMRYFTGQEIADDIQSFIDRGSPVRRDEYRKGDGQWNTEEAMDEFFLLNG